MPESIKSILTINRMETHINIIFSTPELITKQFPPTLKKGHYLFSINSKEDRVWDLVVVYENIYETYNLKYKKGGLVFYSGEPPIVKTYSKEFIDLFDHIITAHKYIKKENNHIEQQALPWYFGYNLPENKINFSYDDLVKMPIPEKSKKISFITSNREFLPGHVARVRFYSLLKEKLGDRVDFFGNGIKPIADKKDALLDYQFSICIENSCIDDYWSEKIADPLLSYTVPIYYGCTNINKYFEDDSFIQINIKEPHKAVQTIEQILNNSDSIYKTHLEAICDARNKLLHEYNLFSSIISVKERFIKNDSNRLFRVEIKPYSMYKANKRGEFYLKLKRFFLRKINRY
jgi:Glycosyltransferase family 10 (fucosyltransferase).